MMRETKIDNGRDLFSLALTSMAHLYHLSRKAFRNLHLQFDTTDSDVTYSADIEGHSFYKWVVRMRFGNQADPTHFAYHPINYWCVRSQCIQYTETWYHHTLISGDGWVPLQGDVGDRMFE